MGLLFFLFMIQFLWIIENKCIMNKDDNSRFDNEYIVNSIHIVTLLLTIYLSFRMGNSTNKMI